MIYQSKKNKIKKITVVVNLFEKTKLTKINVYYCDNGKNYVFINKTKKIHLMIKNMMILLTLKITSY